MLRGKEHEHTKPFSLKGLIGKAADLYKKTKTNHQIHNVIKDIMEHVKKVAERRDRYKVDNIIVISNKVDNIAARPAMAAVDPRLEGMYKKATELVGIGGPKNELARLLEQDCSSSSSSRQQPSIISIVGFGGLGKTALANSLFQDLKAKFDCHVFVSISLNPDMKKIFKNILLQLDEKYSHIDEGWQMNQLIDKIIEFLNNRRYVSVLYLFFIII
jgi:ATP-dependent Lon protease